MKQISNEDFLKILKNHRFIIITGTSKGRERIRKLLIENLDFGYLIDTRRYMEYIFGKQNIKKFVIYVGAKQHTSLKQINKIMNILQHKKKPVIIDSFTDIQILIRYFITRKGTIDWIEFKLRLKDILNKLKKQKKQIIFFTDLKTNYKLEDVDKPFIHKDFIYDASFILNAKDEENVVYKDKSGVYV